MFKIIKFLILPTILTIFTVSCNTTSPNQVKKSDAQRYVISLYSALAQLAEVHSSKNLRKFVLESQTPGGLNWQGVNELRKSGYFKYLEKSVNNILKRLNKA